MRNRPTYEELEQRVQELEHKVSELEAIEKSLRESHESYRKLVALAPDVFAINRMKDGRYLQINEAFCQLTGYRSEEVIGRTAEELNLYAGPEERERMLDALRRRGPIDGLEIRYQAKDGTIIHCLVSARRIRFQGETCLLAVTTNITPLADAQRALAESEEKYRNILETMEEGYYEVDLSGSFTFFNDAICRLYGYPRDELGKMNYRQYLSSEEAKRVYRILNEVFKTGVPAKIFDHEVIGKDGSRKIIEISSSLRRNASGEPIGFRGVARDVTEKINALKALRESEESYRSLVNLAPDSIVVTRLEDGLYLQANEAFCQRLGYRHEEVIGRTVSDLHLYVDPGVRKRVLDALRRDGRLDGFEVKIRRKDGSIEHELMSARIIPYQGEECILVVATNITSLKAVQNALRESEEKYRNILETMEEGYYENDLAGNFTFCNETVLKFFGLSREEFIGTNYRNYMSEETAKRLEESFSEIYRTGIPAEIIDYEVTSRDGSKRTIELSASLVRNASGEPVGFRGITRDMTLRRNAELALKESEVRFRTIFESAQDAIFLKDQELNYTLVNPSMERLFGIKAGDFIGRSDEVVFGPREEARTRQTDLRVLGGEIIEEEESRTIEEMEKIFHTVKVPMTAEDGAIKGICGFSRDLTKTKKLEAQLIQSQKMEAVGTLAGGISHDFNNLMQAVLGYSQILMSNKSKDDPEFAQLREIEQAARRAGELTGQLLAFSRKVESKLRPVDLNREVRQVERLLNRTIPKMIDIDLRLEDPIRTISADPAQLEQVMLNIGLNARDAMPEGGRLVIATKNITLDEAFCRKHPGSTSGDHVLLSITDTGAGMEAETLEHIFEPFYTTKEAGKGTGLGLAMVYGIVKNHSGYISCKSKLGVGTTFNLYFPAIRMKAAEKGEEELATVPRGKGETVLLIDDEEILTTIGERALTAYDYRVLLAGSGEEGLRLYRENMEAIDLIVLDLIMPGMGGKRCLDEILQINPKAKVVIASGYAMEGTMEKDVLARTLGYIKKPFDVRNMLTVIRAVLDLKP